MAELHWTEEQFWASSTRAFWAAVEWRTGQTAKDARREEYRRFYESVMQ